MFEFFLLNPGLEPGYESLIISIKKLFFIQLALPTITLP